MTAHKQQQITQQTEIDSINHITVKLQLSFSNQTIVNKLFWLCTMTIVPYTTKIILNLSARGWVSGQGGYK